MTSEFKFPLRILTVQSSVFKLAWPASPAGTCHSPLLFSPLALSCTSEGLAPILKLCLYPFGLWAMHICSAVHPQRLDPKKTHGPASRGLGTIWAGNSRIWRLSSEGQTWATDGHVLRVGTSSWSIGKGRLRAVWRSEAMRTEQDPWKHKQRA